MSIASEITRLQGCKANIRTALVNKGITSASTHNMADFATDISNISAGGATITVTYNSSFYNKTMTCTKGSTTYTQTTTSSGSTVFNVTDEGTWTITCNGVSRTVYVTLNYSTQMAVTQTVTVYSAANDTVSFTDAAGSKTVTTNASGQGSVSITFIPPSQSITFTSSVAKNPNNLSAAYTKNINLSDSTTAIYVMPDYAGLLYWYGYVKSNLQAVTSTNGWTSSPSTTIQAPSYTTNYIEINVTSNNLCAVAGLQAPSSGKKINAITTVHPNSHSGIRIYPTTGSNKVVNLSNILYDTTDATYTSPALVAYTYTASTNYYIIGANGAVDRGGNIYALWYE